MKRQPPKQRGTTTTCKPVWGPDVGTPLSQEKIVPAQPLSPEDAGERDRLFGEVETLFTGRTINNRPWINCLTGDQLKRLLLITHPQALMLEYIERGPLQSLKSQFNKLKNAGAFDNVI